ncbi:MAG: Hsp33 family molecular chaperone HslO [Mycoplasmatales bacterium]
MSNIYRGTLFNDQCRFYLGDCTELIEQVNQQTTFSPTAIAALGRSLMITNILGLMQKDDAKVSTIINGHGPLGTIIATADSQGNIKAKVTNPLASAPKVSNKKLDVGTCVGKNGFLRVIKDLNMKEPFVSEIPLVSGEIGIDYATYFTQSEQVPTAVAVGVLVDKDHSIKNASVFIVQLMPDCSEEAINKLETFFNSLTGLSEIMSTRTPSQFLEEFFHNDYAILQTIKTNLVCDCSYDKFLEALKMLPPADIIELKQDKEVECICDFCYKKYLIQSEEL